MLSRRTPISTARLLTVGGVRQPPPNLPGLKRRGRKDSRQRGSVGDGHTHGDRILKRRVAAAGGEHCDRVRADLGVLHSGRQTENACAVAVITDRGEERSPRVETKRNRSAAG